MQNKKDKFGKQTARTDDPKTGMKKENDREKGKRTKKRMRRKLSTNKKEIQEE